MKALNKLAFAVFAILLFDMQSLAKTIEVKDKTKPTELVEIVKLDSSLKLDVRYATKDNFLGRPVYKQPKIFLQKQVAESLVQINKELKKDGYGLIIFDGYRPWSVTKIFWDETPIEKRKFVADPKFGSNHNRGCAVDLSLYDLKTGKEIKMPCEYDTFSEKAYPSYMGGTEEENKNRDFLIEKMQEGPFTVHPNEWWHYDYKDCMLYPVLDVSFEEIKYFY